MKRSIVSWRVNEHLKRLRYCEKQLLDRLRKILFLLYLITSLLKFCESVKVHQLELEIVRFTQKI